MVVLTVLGLSVALVTQTEIALGGQERVIERTFYAAEAGFQLSIAKALNEGDFGAITHERQRSDLELGQLVDIRERVRTSPLLCLADLPCNLCSINQGREFVRRNHSLAVNAERFGAGNEETVIGRKSLSLMIDVEPLEPVLDCLADLPGGTEGFRFDDY